MFYINDYDKNINLGYGDNIYTSKLTKGQKTLLSIFYETIRAAEPEIKDFKKKEEHKELSAKLYNDLEAFITDSSEVCGNKVNSDGFYISFEGNLYNANIIK